MRTRFSLSLLIISSVLCVSSVRSQQLPDLAKIKAAAEAGNAEAQDKLGQSYENQFNFSSAVIWYRKAAEQNIPHAQWKLGIMLVDGRPKLGEGSVAVEKAPDEGIKWLLLSANQGRYEAQLDLARCYDKSNGVKQDYVEAYKWYRLASRQNSSSVAFYLNSLILKMSQRQIQDGEERAGNFRPHQSAKGELPDPQYAQAIVLKNISGPADRRFALINNQTLAKGEAGKVKVGKKAVTVKCLDIKESSVVVEIEGIDQPKELRLK